ncbi:MAG TPA: hypothetical protein VJV79_07930 [Polyangiaceae bacterium]|nr:hypothetical protein [Polyangiaceae bacterium]
MPIASRIFNDENGLEGSLTAFSVGHWKFCQLSKVVPLDALGYPQTL